MSPTRSSTRRRCRRSTRPVGGGSVKPCAASASRRACEREIDGEGAAPIDARTYEAQSDSVIVTEWITTSSWGRSLRSVLTLCMASTTSIPFTTWPNKE